MTNPFKFIKSTVRSLFKSSFRRVLTMIDDSIGIQKFFNLRDINVPIQTIDDALARDKAQNRFSQELSEVGQHDLVPLAYHVSDHGYEISTKYLYRMKTYGTNPFSGIEAEHWFSIGSDTQLSPDEAFEILQDSVAGFEADYEIIIDSYDLRNAFIME